MSDVEKVAAELSRAKRAADQGAAAGESPIEAMRIANALLTIAKGAAAMTVDQRADLERACRVHGVTLPRLLSAAPKETVHYLRAGVAICGRMGALVPASWPPGNKWSADHTRVNCDGCLTRFSSLRSSTR